MHITYFIFIVWPIIYMGGDPCQNSLFCSTLYMQCEILNYYGYNIASDNYDKVINAYHYNNILCRLC